MHASDPTRGRDAAHRPVFTQGMFAAHFVYARDAPPDEAVSVVLAATSKEALQEAVPSGQLLYRVALTPADGERASEGPLQVVCLRDGRCILVGSCRWPMASASHADLWASLRPDVQKRIEAQWAVFARSLGRLDVTRN